MICCIRDHSNRASSCDVEFGGRQQRSLDDATATLHDFADRQPCTADFDELDNVQWSLHVDANQNERHKLSFYSRAHDYSTTSLEFSDVESLVSDSVGKLSSADDDDDNAPLQNARELDEISRDFDANLHVRREPASYVEFTLAANYDNCQFDLHPRSRLFERSCHFGFVFGCLGHLG